MLLITRSYRRQKYIDELNECIEENFTLLSMFNKNPVVDIKDQFDSLTSEEEREQLFLESFKGYKLLKFGKTRLEVDAFNPEDCRTFSQFNDALKKAFMVMDYVDNLNYFDYFD